MKCLSTIYALMVIVALAACSDSPTLEIAQIDGWERVAEMPSATQPSGIDVSGSGDIYVVDRAGAEVYRISSDGSLAPVFGGRGQGPGELRRPAAIAVSDTIRVADEETGRIHEFTSAGTFIASVVMPPAAGKRVSINSRGEVALCTWGLGTDVLARVLGSDGNELLSVGELQSSTTLFGSSVEEINTVIQARRIPEAFLNVCFPHLGENGDLWLLFDASGNIQRYDKKGALLWEQSLADLPEFGDVREAYFAANAEAATSPSFSLLSYFAAAAEIGDDLFVILNMPSGFPALLMHVAGDGTVARFRVDGIYNLGLGKMAAWGESLYIASVETGAIFHVPVPTRTRSPGE